MRLISQLPEPRVVFEITIPRNVLLNRTGVGCYDMRNPFEVVAELTGRHVNGRFVRTVLRAKGADTISSMQDDLRASMKVRFEQRYTYGDA